MGRKGRGKQKKQEPTTSKRAMEEDEDASDVDSDEGSDDSDDGFAWEMDSDNGDANDQDDADDEDGEEDDDDDDDEEGEGEQDADNAEPKEKPVQFPEYSVLSNVKNKMRRREMYLKMKAEKKKAKREAREKRQKEYEALGDKAPPKQVPRTLENTREPDETMVDPNDEEVKEDEAADEFASYFRGDREPKILVTTSDNPHTKTIKFCREFKQTIPNADFRWRNRMSIKKMVTAANNRGYTDIAVVNEDLRKPNGLLLIHLPHGPTAFFKLSSIKYCKDLKRRAKLNEKRPEVIMNNFNTRLGHTIGRMFASLFHFDPEFIGRRVVTFHNQRDYIFFRHHKYGQSMLSQEFNTNFFTGTSSRVARKSRCKRSDPGSR